MNLINDDEIRTMLQKLGLATIALREVNTDDQMAIVLVYAQPDPGNRSL